MFSCFGFASKCFHECGYLSQDPYFVPLLEHIQEEDGGFVENHFQQPCESVGVKMSDIPLHSFQYPQAISC